MVCPGALPGYIDGNIHDAIEPQFMIPAEALKKAQRMDDSICGGICWEGPPNQTEPCWIFFKLRFNWLEGFHAGAGFGWSSAQVQVAETAALPRLIPEVAKCPCGQPTWNGQPGFCTKKCMREAQ